MFKRLCTINKIMKLVHVSTYGCYIPHLSTIHQSELTIKAIRRSFLNKAVLNQNKDVIYAQKRTPQDRIMKLVREGKCVGVIQPYGGSKQDEIDVVLPGKAMKRKYDNVKYQLQTAYVRVQGKQYQCIINRIQMGMQNFIQKVILKQYVAGKPNKLTIPIMATHIQKNTLFQKKVQFQIRKEELEVICYNYQYPTKLYYDISYVNYDRPYRIGDLANTFPPGLILDPSVNPHKVLFQFLSDGADAERQGSMETIMENLKIKSQLSKLGQKSSATTGSTQAKSGDAKQQAGKGGATKAAQPAKTTQAAGKKKK